MLLKTHHLSFGFTPGKNLLSNLDLSLEQGRIYALVGSNGAGKTTLFNLITGFLRPIDVGILFKEQEITKLPPYKINRLGIGRTFQDLRIVTDLSVTGNIILAMQNNPTDKLVNALLPQGFHKGTIREMQAKAEEIISRFFLTEVKSSLAGEISYGQQKLLTLGCCVANGAELLLLDEPVAGIQPEYRNKIVILLKELKEQGKTILLIEHNTEFIAETADEIFFLHEGKITSFSDTESLRSNPLVMEAYT